MWEERPMTRDNSDDDDDDEEEEQHILHLVGC